MADNVINDIYRLDLDQAALARVKSGIASGRLAIQQMTTDVKAQPVAFDQAAKAAENYAKAIEQSNKARATAAQKSSSVGASQSLGKAESGINQIAQLLPGAGGESARLLGDITGTVQKLPELGKAVKDLGAVTVATGVGVAGLSIALALYNQEQARTKALATADLDSRQRALTLIQTGSKEEIQARINALTKQKEINKATADDANKLFQDLKDETLKNLGPAAAAAEYYASKVGAAAGPYQAASENAEKANKNLGSTSTELELLQKQSGLTAQSVDDVTKALKEAQYIGSDISNRASADLEAYQLANNGTSKQLDERLRNLQLELAVTQNSSLAAQARVDALGRETEAGKAAQAEVDNLTKKQNGLQTSLEVLSQSFVRASIQAREMGETTKQLIDVTSQLAAENKKYDDVKAARIIEDARNAALEAQQKIIDAEKVKEAQRESLDKISAMKSDAAEKDNAALSEMYSARDEINKTAMDNQLKLLTGYIKEESRSTEDYNTNRLRKMQDLYTSLSSLAASRDVSAFVSTQAAGNLDLARGSEDFSTSSRRRLQDYQEQSRVDEANRQKQLADLQANYDKESRLRASNLQNQIEQEQVAAVVRLKQSQIEEQKLSDLKAMYAKQDLDSRRRLEDDAHRDTVTKLAERQRQLAIIVGGAFNPIVSALGSVTRSVVDFITQARQAASRPVTSSYSSAARSAVLGSYDLGKDFVPQTGIYQLHKGERVVTAAENRSYNPSWSKSSGMQIIINNPQFGAIATPADVAAGQEFIIRAIEQATGAA